MLPRTLLVLVLLFTLTACAGSTGSNSYGNTSTAAAGDWMQQEAMLAQPRNDNSTRFEPASMASSTAANSFADSDADAVTNSEFRAAPQPQAEPTQTTRQVIYTGQLVVLSPDPAAAIDTARRLAEEAGGYADSIRSQSIRLRVPADRFDAVMESLGKLGLVTHREIDAADVTAQLVDLQIRLDNLEALRGRMKTLLERADKVEDALNIEKELGRLTGQIEQLKGQLRLMKDRVALSTINVTFNTPTGTASGLAGRVTPFPWVATVGSEAFGARRLPNAQPKLGRGAKLDLPPGFVRFFQQDYHLFAIDRDQVVLKVTRQANYDQAPARFWVDQVRDRLTRQLGVPVDEPRRVALGDDETAYTMTGNRPSGEEALGYFVGLASNDDHVYLIEAWGPRRPARRP